MWPHDIQLISKDDESALADFCGHLVLTKFRFQPANALTIWTFLNTTEMYTIGQKYSKVVVQVRRPEETERQSHFQNKYTPRQLVLPKRKIGTQKIASQLGISQGPTHYIGNRNLGYHEVSATYVPEWLVLLFMVVHSWIWRHLDTYYH